MMGGWAKYGVEVGECISVSFFTALVWYFLGGESNEIETIKHLLKLL